MTRKETTVDVAIVGAGLAGLTAAHALEQAGHRVAVLEARAEVGGRTRSRVIDGCVVELGGTFLNPVQWRLTIMARTLGLTVKRTGLLGAPIQWRTNRSTLTAPVPALTPPQLVKLVRAGRTARRLARNLDADAPWRSAAAADLDGVSVADWLDSQDLDGTAQWLLANGIGGYASHPIDRLSLLEFLWWIARYHGNISALRTGSSHHIAEGAQQVCLRLADRLTGPMLLDTPVDAIHQDANVELYANGARVCLARRAIVTAPLPVLDRIDFDPQLDADQQQLVTSLRSGHITKVGGVARAPIRVRRRANIGGDALVFTARLDNQLAGYSLHDPWEPALGDPLAVLAEDFGLDADEVNGAVVHWSQEPFAGGSYVAFAPGQITRHGPHLRRPHGLVHFAGAERSSMPQQMEGAVESGTRVAAEVDRRLEYARPQAIHAK
ncbi:MAG: flavin monoamine oxidase family protein [Mycobacterium sp.]